MQARFVVSKLKAKKVKPHSEGEFVVENLVVTAGLLLVSVCHTDEGKPDVETVIAIVFMIWPL